MLHHSSIVVRTFSIGPYTAHWSSVLSVAGFVISYFVCRLNGARAFGAPNERHPFELFLVYISVGLLVAMSTGDLSFPEALLVLAIWTFVLSRQFRLSYLRALDQLAMALPAGLFLGRIGNFVTGTFYGRPSSVPWSMIFGTDPAHLPRHPSQLYEAGLEGIGLMLLLFLLNRHWARTGKVWNGRMASIFLFGYGVCRFSVGCFRQPDPEFGMVFGNMTMGQIISLGLMLLGAGLSLVSEAIAHPEVLGYRIRH